MSHAERRVIRDTRSESAGRRPFGRLAEPGHELVYGDLVKPFLLLATRAEDAAADNEYESFLAFTRLDERDLRRSRLEQRALGNVDLQDWSGILLGGGPFNSSDPEGSKSPVQRRVEADLHGLLGRVIDADFPFLGACYGIGTLGSHQGAVVDRRYAEPVGSVPVTLTREGRRDPLLQRAARHLRRVRRPQGGGEQAAALRRSARQFPHVPGAGVQDRLPRLCHPVPSRTGRGRPVHPDRRLPARGLFRARPGGRAEGACPSQQGHPPACHPAPVRPASRRPRAGRGRPAAAGQRFPGGPQRIAGALPVTQLAPQAFSAAHPGGLTGTSAESVRRSLRRALS